MRHQDIKKQDFAQTLARGLACLETLSAAPGPLSVSEVADAMEVHRASARRILLTLVSLGYVHEDRGAYVPAPKILALGRGLLSKTSVWTAVSPEVVKLADKFNEPCSISVLENLDILFVCRDSTRRIYTARLGVGDRLPAHCSASGKVLLSALSETDLTARLGSARLRAFGPASITSRTALKAALTQVRKDDYATAVDEMEEGTLSIAVPLRERRHNMVAAMSVASHRSRMSPDDLKTKVLPVLRAVASRVERTLQDFQDRNLAIL